MTNKRSGKREDIDQEIAAAVGRTKRKKETNASGSCSPEKLVKRTRKTKFAKVSASSSEKEESDDNEDG